jgi:biotin transport system substrate-specific component
MDSDVRQMPQVIAGQESQRIGQVWVVDAGVVVGGSLLMAVCAHVAVPLWFTPVPITLQTFGVMLLSLTLGGWRAAAALVLYLLEGISGGPVFSPHGAGGAAQLFGPTGGYLMAYPFAALAGGWFAERFSSTSRYLALILGALACDAIIFIGGAAGIFAVSHRPMASVITLAVLPFLPGEVLKGSAAIAAALGKDKLRHRA